MPWSGPRPSRASVATSTPDGRGGRSCPGALTTTTGPSTTRLTMPTTRRRRVEPCHSRAAFGRPILVDRPPAKTIPAVFGPTRKRLARWAPLLARRVSALDCLDLAGVRVDADHGEPAEGPLNLAGSRHRHDPERLRGDPLAQQPDLRL